MYLLMPMEDGLDCGIVIHVYLCRHLASYFEVSFPYAKEAELQTLAQQEDANATDLDTNKLRYIAECFLLLIEHA